MSVSNGMRPVHPGEILGEELRELGMSANALAAALGVPTNRITAILKGQRGITADTALRLSRYLGTTPQLWLNLQKTFELRTAELSPGRTSRRVCGLERWLKLPAACPNNLTGSPLSVIYLLPRRAWSLGHQ